MDSMMEYKCPCCGGAIGFDSAVQKMKCPYCDTEFEMDTLKEYDEELKKSAQEDMSWEKKSSEWEEEDENNVAAFVCKSCGGEIVADKNTAATSCPFCDNPVIMTERLAGSLKPDFVIPFKLDKNAAKEGMKKHLQGKKLLPKAFKDENHIDEIKGVYVPFWLFDADVDANMRYKGSRIRSWSDGRYRYTETSYFSILRSGSMGFDVIPVDGSSKMPNDMMESLEPFDFSEAVDFQTAYLAGYLADKYDVTAEESEERVNTRIKGSVERSFASTVIGYSALIPESCGISLKNAEEKYALFPVWILNTTWNGEKYVFAMNGQTGKFAGNLPVDKGAYHKWLWGLTAAIGVGFYAIATLIHYLF